MCNTNKNVKTVYKKHKIDIFYVSMQAVYRNSSVNSEYYDYNIIWTNKYY